MYKLTFIFTKILTETSFETDWRTSQIMKPNIIRIKDIAKMAGVSEGTVDRVLHKRGKVSKSSEDRVNKILNKINYRPNLIAKTLGKNKNYRIVAITPNPALDPYWQQSFDGLKLGEKQLAQVGIQLTLELHFYDPHKKETFREVTLKVFHSHPDGVLVAPLFYYASIPFFKKLTESNIPFILFNTHIAEANALSFIGQDLYKSGCLAAELLSLGKKDSSSFAIIHIDEDISNSVHLIEKEKGFKDYFKRYDNIPLIHTFLLSNPKHPSFKHELELIAKTPNIAGVFVSTSKVFTVASYLKKTDPAIRIIGYDLIKENLEGLQHGTIDFLINQNPMRQAKLGIQALSNYLLFNKEVPSSHLFPLEIITAQNVSSYLSHDSNRSGITV